MGDVPVRPWRLSAPEALRGPFGRCCAPRNHGPVAWRGCPVAREPSRHTAGHNLASYHDGTAKPRATLFTDMDACLPDLEGVKPLPWHENLSRLPPPWLPGWMTVRETRCGFGAPAVAGT